MSKWPPLISENPPPKIPSLELIKQEIPCIQNLHPSFWKNPRFLRWQLMRLNENYRKDVDKLWWEFWVWSKHKKYPEDVKLAIKEIYDKFPPMPEEALEKWIREFTPYPSYSAQLKIIIKYFGKFGDFKPYPHETFEKWCGRLSRELDPILFHSMLESQFRNKKGQMVIPPWELAMLKPPPIPWTVRFPLPYFLDKTPRWPAKGKKRGRPPDWVIDPLVYELSQAGMKDMEIVRLLFGVEKSTEKCPDTYKHPILVEIANKKKTAGKIVSQAYPL